MLDAFPVNVAPSIMIFRFSLYGFLKNQRYFEPFMMLFLLGSGNSFASVGFLIGFRELCINATNIPAGAIADIYGRRRCMLFSYLAYITAFLCFGLCPNELFYLFIAVFFFGIGEAFREGTHKSMIFTWLRLNDRLGEKTKVYGYTRSWSKIGSAVSIPIATAIAYYTDNLQMLFLAALLPYSIGFIALASYPKELDGSRQGEVSIRRVFVHMWQTIRDSVKVAGLRRLMIESMGFEGFFDVIKDYVQPMIKIMVLGIPLLLTLGDDKRGTLLIGVVYFFFHLGSAWSSRKAHRLSTHFGGEEPASRFMWRCKVLVYLAMLPCLAFELYLPVIALFFLLYLMQSAWRPLIISRFDAYSPETHGTSILSVESQSQTFAKMLFAPLLGFIVDQVATFGSGGKFWPIAAVGVLIGAYMLLSSPERSSGHRPVMRV
ncbi:MAG: MFS transporter [Rhodoferax sp.]|nr:MFS transporter [Rhodoferax sp.]